MQLTISARADITFPRVVRDLLMFAPSLRRTPLAPVLSALSDPAKSTKLIFETCETISMCQRQSCARETRGLHYAMLRNVTQCYATAREILNNLFSLKLSCRIKMFLSENNGEHSMGPTRGFIHVCRGYRSMWGYGDMGLMWGYGVMMLLLGCYYV